MLKLEHLKTLQHVSISIQIIFREVFWSPTYLATQNATHTHQTYVATVPQSTFYI